MLPADQVDDRGHPYVTIPFGDSTIVQARLEGPAGIVGRRVPVRLAVWSLNNEIARATLETVLEVGASPLFEVRQTAASLVNAPHWPLWGELTITYRGAVRRYLRLEVGIEPSTWRVLDNYSGWFNPGEQKKVRLELRPPPSVGAPAEATCNIRLDAQEPGIVYTHQMHARIEPAKVEIRPAAFHVPFVQEIPGDLDVFAEVQLFRVPSPHTPRLVARDELVAPAFGRLKLIDVPWSGEGEIFVLAAGTTIATRAPLLPEGPDGRSTTARGSPRVDAS